MCVRVRVSVRAGARACARVCVRACVRAFCVFIRSRLARIVQQFSQSCPIQAMAVVNMLQRQLTNMLVKDVENTVQP